MKIQIQLSTSAAAKPTLAQIRLAMKAYSKKHGEHPVKIDAAYEPKKIRRKGLNLYLLLTDTEDQGQYVVAAEYDADTSTLKNIGSAPEESFEEANGPELKAWLRKNTVSQYK